MRKQTAGVPSAVGNVIWIVLFGWWLALIISGTALCLTIIGIPFGIANFKLVPVSLVPLGREVVPIDEVGAFGGVAVARSQAMPH